MKTAAMFTALALVVSAMAEEWDPLPKRDVATIQNVIMQTSTALQTLDTTVKAFDGSDFSKLATDAANVKTVLVQSTQQIQATTPISAQDAITLQSSLSPVQSLGASLVQDLVAKKPQIQQASLCGIVQQQTSDIGGAASGLIQATVSKVPANLQQVAGTLTAQFTSQLNDLSGQFAPGNCTNAAGGSASAAGITFGNTSTSSGTTGSSTNGGTTKSAASTQIASVLGLIVAAGVGLMML